MPRVWNECDKFETSFESQAVKDKSYKSLFLQELSFHHNKIAEFSPH